MLKRIKVRSKLLLLLAAPLAAVGLFAASGAVDRFDAADESRTLSIYADLAAADVDLALGLQVEQLRSVARATGATADVESARAATDAAIATWNAAHTATEPVAAEALEAALEVAEAKLLDIAQTRDQLDRGTANPAVAIADFRVTVRELDAVTVAIAGQVDDLEMFRILTDQLRIARAQSALAEISAGGLVGMNSTLADAGRTVILRDAASKLAAQVAQFSLLSDPATVAQADSLLGTTTFLSVGRGTPLEELEGYLERLDTAAAREEWIALGEQRLADLAGLSDTLIQEANTRAAVGAELAEDEANDFVVLAGSVVVGALLLAFLIGGSISQPLRRLTVDAQRLADKELPALVESLRSGETALEVGELTAIDSHGRDEIATLARSVENIHRMTVEVAEEQGALLQRGISEMFVNLARRNQSLLDRQIEFIDELESTEENPDALENLFRLDHLATRMRRNAESLLVLAGSEPARRRGQVVELTDVVRVAMGEIEEFGRIRLLSIDPATVAGGVAVDLAHLLSEFMENGSQFSPPDTPVEVTGHRDEDGSYRLTVTDRGIGLARDQMAAANELLATPPTVGLELRRSLGFTVVSRLAHRLGITVWLEPSPHGGVTASVTVPAEMIGEVDPATRLEDPSADLGDPAAGIGRAARIEDSVAGLVGAPPADLADPVAPRPDLVVPPTGPTGAGDDPLFTLGHGPGRDHAPAEASVDPQPVSSSLPPPPTPLSGDMFDALGIDSGAPDRLAAPDTDIFSSLEIDDPPPTTAPQSTSSGLPQRRPARAITDQSDSGSDPAPPSSALPPPLESLAPPSDPAPPSEPAPRIRAASVGAVDAAVTSAGLIRRTSKRADAADASRATDTSTAGSTVRSPEEVREMLSRYRSGLRKGRQDPSR